MIILQTTAVRLIRKGGGVAKKKNTWVKVRGGTRVVFNCPACHNRNNRNILSTKHPPTPKEDFVAYNCHACDRYIEVRLALVEAQPQIVLA
jgi:hypothetical protein